MPRGDIDTLQYLSEPPCLEGLLTSRHDFNNGSAPTLPARVHAPVGTPPDIHMDGYTAFATGEKLHGGHTQWQVRWTMLKFTSPPVPESAIEAARKDLLDAHIAKMATIDPSARDQAAADLLDAQRALVEKINAEARTLAVREMRKALDWYMAFAGGKPTIIPEPAASEASPAPPRKRAAPTGFINDPRFDI